MTTRKELIINKYIELQKELNENYQINGLFPSFIINLKSMKGDHFGKCKKFLVEYYITTR